MLLEIKDITFSYTGKKNSADDALSNVSMNIKEGEFIGIIGHTGSGKSTLIKHLNGLLKADSGEVFYKGENIYDKNYKMSELRKEVGLVFQYPEYQLFKPTILEDVMFGPMNKYNDEEKARNEAKKALEQVGIREELYNEYPHDLSGGQKRRVAIAGVLAMNPNMLVLDEPTAGLDPQGKLEILNLLKAMQQDNGITIVLVSHSMEEIAEYVDRIIVMHEGKIACDGTPKEVFARYEEIEKMGLRAPEVTYLGKKLGCKETITTMEDAIKACKLFLNQKRKG